MYVSCSLTFSLETKMPCCQNPSRKKKVTMLTTDDEWVSGSTKLWIFKSMWNIQSSRQEFYTPVCYCGVISTPLSMTLHKTKCDWLLYLSVKWYLRRALTIRSSQDCQTFFCQPEGLTTQDQEPFGSHCMQKQNWWNLFVNQPCWCSIKFFNIVNMFGLIQNIVLRPSKTD